MNTIDFNTPATSIQALLASKGWITNEQITHVTKAGEGNMNMVMKVETDQRSFILKQSRPFVFKYPQVPAPEGRICTEYAFYQAILGSAVESKVPTILAFDADDFLMMIEFVEGFEDMVSLYGHKEISSQVFDTLIQDLATIHQCQPTSYPDNDELKALNHQHIFVLPFLEDNGFSLDEIQEGLQALSLPFKNDPELKSRVESIGKRYLAKGDTLLHGDYYPGSWMQSRNRIYIIDAEFSHLGFKEFDLGVMAAHLIMATSDKTYLSKVIDGYTLPKDAVLVKQMAGIEIVRRLIGLAQLPLDRTLEEKRELLETAKSLILS